MGSEVSEEGILGEFGRVWLECGLSCGEGSLRGVEGMGGEGEGGGLGRVVYGSDYPGEHGVNDHGNAVHPHIFGQLCR